MNKYTNEKSRDCKKLSLFTVLFGVVKRKQKAYQSS